MHVSLRETTSRGSPCSPRKTPSRYPPHPIIAIRPTIIVGTPCYKVNVIRPAFIKVYMHIGLYLRKDNEIGGGGGGGDGGGGVI